MGKANFSVETFASRLVKVAMVVVLLPLAVSLLEGFLSQLDVISLSGATFGQWIVWGFQTYVGIHLLLYRPVPVFKASHRLFSTIAVWLFGGHVASTEASKGGKGAKAEGVAQGSTLVAFSPYVIPLYTILVCVAGWLAAKWVDRSWVDGPAAFLIGVTIAFHWLMTADDLQAQRERWHVEAYLLAIGLVFVLTLLVGGSALPLTVPGFSFVQALAEGMSRAQAFYSTLVQELFFR